MAGIENRKSIINQYTMSVTKNQFNAELERIFSVATELGLSYIGVHAGQLHRKLGSYPGKNHTMPTCCECMRRKLDSHAGDRIIAAPEKGDGASLLIQYIIPRKD